MTISLSATTKAELDNLLASAVESGRIPGAVLAVGTADAELYHGAAGLRFHEEPEKGSVDEDSIFWLCSMTKLVVTIALLQLIEKGVLDYDTPAEKYLPELANPVIVSGESVGQPLASAKYTPAKNKILIRHLLCHTSGISYALHAGKWPYDAASYGGEFTAEKFFSLLKGDLPGFPVQFEPGTDWAYGWGTDLSGHIIKRITGQTLQKYCDENIFGPLELRMSFLLTPEVKNHLVQLTHRAESGTLEKWAEQAPTMVLEPETVGIEFEGSGIYSTMRDYLTLLRHILAIKGGHASNAILKGSSVEFLFSSQTDKAAQNIYSFTGWDRITFGGGICLATEDWPSGRKKGSGFWYGWAGTYFLMDPSTDVAAVYGTQLVPTRDSEVEKLWQSLEEAIYKDKS